jgi:hypothetical protein
MSLAPMLAQTKHPNVDLVAFRFQVKGPTGTDDPDNLFPGYQGVSNVVRTSEGLYSITFDFKYPFMLACTGAVESADSNTLGTHVQVVSYTASTGVLVVKTTANDNGLVEDPVDDAWVHVICVMARQTGAYVTQAI